MKANKLTDKNWQVLGFIREYQAEHGFAPTIREIGRAVGINSTSLVVHNLNALARAGKIERNGYKTARAIRLVDDDSVPTIYREYANLNDTYALATDELKALKLALQPFVDMWEKVVIEHPDNAIFAAGKAANGAPIGAVVTYGQLRRLLALARGK